MVRLAWKAVKLSTPFRWRCAQGTHPFPSRTRWLRPERPMVLCWRRHGRAGGCRIYGGLAQLGERLPCKQEVTSSNLVFSTRYVNKVKISIICTLKTAHRKFSIKRAMQTADDADGGNLFPDIIAEGAGYSATARIERKRERTRDGALQKS